MKKLIITCAIVGLLGMLCPANGAPTYDADFNAEPLGPLSTQPNTDPLPLHLPTHVITDGVSIVDVVASAGDLLNKPVLLDSVPGALASAGFFNPYEYTSGRWHVSWESLVLGVPVDTRPEQGNVAIVAEHEGHLPAVWDLKYNTDGSFQILDATGYHSVGAFVVSQSDRFDLFLDLDSATYELTINSVSALSGNLIEPGEFSHTVFRSNARGWAEDLVSFVFDNLTVESILDVKPIPAPGAFLLGGIGFGFVSWLRRRRTI